MRRLSRDGHPPARAGERRCECGTVLCRYNEATRCWPCGGWVTIYRGDLAHREDMADLLTEIALSGKAGQG